MTGRSASDAQREWTADRQAVYAELRGRGIDAARLSDLISRYGPAILDRELPYLVVAARNLATDEHRRELRHARLAERMRQVSAMPFTDSDPAEIVMSRTTLVAAVNALRNLDEADAWALWWHAAGFSDEEIAQLWNDASFEPRNPSPALLRKRRERARKKLHVMVDD